MPWRLIGFIIILGIFLVFIAFNLGNKCDINMVFHTFKDVPVFLTAFASFVLGMLCAVPLAVSLKLKRKNKGEKEETSKTPQKRGKKEAEAKSGVDGNSFSDGGPYGIN